MSTRPSCAPPLASRSVRAKAGGEDCLKLRLRHALNAASSAAEGKQGLRRTNETLATSGGGPARPSHSFRKDEAYFPNACFSSGSSSPFFSIGSRMSVSP